MPTVVKLSIPELYTAANIGVLRQIESVRKGLPDKHGFDGMNGWSVHIDGAAGEIAVAKCLGTYWGGSCNTFKTEGDVGKLEVRTRSKDYYDLIVRDDDRDDSIFVLVIHPTGREYTVVGWITGRDAKQNKWRKDYGGRPPAYFVPQSELRDISELTKCA